MTEVSLSTAVFGADEGQKGILSTLFSSNSTLPEKPNNVNFPETPLQKARRERNDEKKKKRKKKELKDSGGKSLESGENGDDATSEEKEMKSDVKKRKVDSEAEIEADMEKDGSNTPLETEDGSSDLQEERTIFVGNLPLNTNRRSLENLFKDCGKIKSSRLRSFGTTGVKVAPEHAGNQVWLNISPYLPISSFFLC